MAEQNEQKEENRMDHIPESAKPVPDIGVLLDIGSRETIVTSMDRNLFVEAGAGSGKTTMLVNRMVAMVESGIEISRIAAITFTKAAAGEFYDRFQKLLIKRSHMPEAQSGTETAEGGSAEKENGKKRRAGDLNPPTPDTCKLCEKALENINLCFMGTIDSFCNLILSEHPSEAGILSNAGIVSDEEAESVYRQEFIRFSNGEHGPEMEAFTSAFRSFHWNPDKAYIMGVSYLMNHRNVEFQYTPVELSDLDDARFAADRTDLIRALRLIRQHPELRDLSTKEKRAAWEDWDPVYRNLTGTWKRNYAGVGYGLRKLKEMKLTVAAAGVRYGAVTGRVFENKGRYLELSGHYQELETTISNLGYRFSMTYFHKCLPFLEQTLRSRGQMTFFDYLFYLRNMLKQDAEKEGKLIRYIAKRHSYYLIDEFQDTDPLQAEIFFYLAAKDPVPMWSDCVPRPGSLFIVGDPKQSIYRFRGADVSSYLRVKELFQATGGEILMLTRNFRSTRKLCEYFNTVFSNLLPRETPIQSKFEPIPLKASVPGASGVFEYKVYDGKVGKSSHPNETDPKQIVKILQLIVDRQDLQIWDPKEEWKRPIRYGDIMIITSAKTSLPEVRKTLDSVNIPVREEGNVAFSDNEALQEIYRIYAALADAGDQVALYAALTGRLIGLYPEQLRAFRSAGGKISLFSSFDPEECTDGEALRVNDEIEKLKALRKKALRMSSAALFVEIMEEFRVFRIVTTDNMEVLYYVIERIRDLERSGSIISLSDGKRYIQGLLSPGANEEERCLSLSEDDNRVHLANLHKVKGLEAPVVILAASSDFEFPAKDTVNHSGDRTKGYIFKLSEGMFADEVTYIETSEYKARQDEEWSNILAEKVRKLYVAATRAGSILIISRRTMVDWRSGDETEQSRWKPLLEAMGVGVTVKNILALKKPAGQQPAAQSVSCIADQLYKEGKKERVLRKRKAPEAETYEVKYPSKEVPEEEKIPAAAAAEAAVGEMTGAEATEAYGETIAAATATEAGAEAAGDADEELPLHKTNYAAHRDPGLLGTMTHKLMEILVTSRGRMDPDAAVKEILQEFLEDGSEKEKQDLGMALKGVADRMQNGGYPQKSSVPQDILKTLLEADEVHCEVPFTYYEIVEGKKVLWNGVMDVIYRKGSEWHIVDYKTNLDGSDLDRKYKPQMDAYIKAFKEIAGKDADALTYHIDI